MPSERMDSQGRSPSSFFSMESHLAEERPLGFWKSNTVPNYGVVSSPLGKQTALDPQIGKSSDFLHSYLNQDLRANHLLEKHVAGLAGAASRSLPRTLEHELGGRPNFSVNPASVFVNGDRLGLIGAQCENGLFSSSLSELYSRKLRLSSNNSSHGHSVGAAASQYVEEESFESLKELEAQTIGNLLPDNDDDLFSGVTADGLEPISKRYNGDDNEDLDVFSNVGGMDLGDDGFPSGQINSDTFGINSNGNIGVSLGGEHPFGEHPSRTLFVRNINSNVEDSEIRSHFEQFGDIRALYTACKHRGFVMISYYDIRAARNAMKSLQNKPLQQRKLDIHFSIPKDNPSDKDINQGTLVVFNLDSSICNDELQKLFGVYGEIKEIRETPHRNDHKFIEFYDVRAAEAALRELNRREIAGKRINLEPSRPGGARRLMQSYTSESDHDDSTIHLQQMSPSSTVTTRLSGLFSHGGIGSIMDKESLYGSHPATGSTLPGFLESSFNHVLSPSVPNGLPSPIRMGSVGHQSGINESGHSRSEMNLDFLGMQNFHPHSLPDVHDGWSNASGFPRNSPNLMSSNSLTSVPLDSIENQQFCRLSSNGPSHEVKEAFFNPGNGSCPPAGRHYIWNNTHHPQPQGMMWPNSPSFVNGVSSPHPQQLHVVPRSTNQLMTPIPPLTNHHVGSAPPVNSSVWDRGHVYSGESPDASFFHPGSLGNARISGNSSHSLEYVPRNVFPGCEGSCIDLTAPSKNVAFNSHPQRCMVFPARGQMIPVMNAFDSTNERIRNRRNENISTQVDNKRQFELDIDRIAQGDDKRTTLMIKNIPNKYTSKMLLAAIDERHRGTYDFIYLPIDFKNKCNVGYAFINITEPSLIIPFYQYFNGKKWEKFNSEKVASITYARIQGKAALIAHFQNSSLMNEDKRCRPILFHTDGPNAGDQVPFPMGVNVRPRFGKSRASTSEDNSKESLLDFPNGGELCSGESTFGSMKESD